MYRRLHRIGAVLSSVLLLAVLGACGGGDDGKEGSSEEPTTLKLGNVFPESDGWNEAAKSVASCVDDETDGALTIKVYPNSQLGGESETLEGLKLGTVDMAFAGPGVETQFYPGIGLFDQPYLFESYDAANEVMDGPIGQKLYADMAEQSGIRVLASGAQGFRYILTKDTAINSLDDLKGLKIRVPDADTFVNTFKALGANPTPMDFAEVYTSMQTGVIDGFEGVPDVVLSAKLNEVGGQLAKTNHVLATLQLMISDKVYNDLSDESRETLQTCATDAWTKQREAAQADNEKSERKLQKLGVELTTPDLDQWSAAVTDAVDSWAKKTGTEDLLAQIRN